MNKNGWLAVSPLLLFLLLLLGSGILSGDFANMPILTAFLAAAVYGVVTTRGIPLQERIRICGRGAGEPGILFIIWILLAAGVFSASASAIGCIDETVRIILGFVPSGLVLVGLFVAGAFLSMATGSGMGTIVAIGPVAVGLSQASGGNLPLMSATVVCGAMFGDNLSFISDTTVVATQTQGCEMKDKFRTNIKIALPAALLAIALYVAVGWGFSYSYEAADIHYIKIIPYVAVIVMAVLGVDVLLSLILGTALCGILGLASGDMDFFQWCKAMSDGMTGMGEMVIIVLLAAGVMALIRHNGGLEFIVSLCTRFVRGRRSAEACICLLVSLVCCATSHNTIAIVSVADVVKDLSRRYGVDPRKAAALLDTSSCVTLELLPYSTHLLCMAGIAGLTASSMLPFVYYAFMLAAMVSLSVLFGLPRFRHGAAEQARPVADNVQSEN